MDKAITTVLLTIAGVVCALFIFNSVYPAVHLGGGAISGISGKLSERIKSRIDIIHVAGELDSSGNWQDTNDNGLFDVFVWVKNTGLVDLAPVKDGDVFFGPEGNFTRIPHEEYASGYPRWTYEVENGAEWEPGTTIKIDIQYDSALSSGNYYVKFITQNGVSDEEYFSM